MIFAAVLKTHAFSCKTLSANNLFLHLIGADSFIIMKQSKIINFESNLKFEFLDLEIPTDKLIYQMQISRKFRFSEISWKFVKQFTEIQN